MYSGDFGSRDGVQWHVEIVGGSGTGGELSSLQGRALRLALVSQERAAADRME